MVVFFGGSIFVHELGHFLAARWRGLKVLKFSIGFGPKLFSWKGRDGCEYRISALPFGGYVALPQLADMGRLEGGSGRSGEDMGEEERLARTLPRISYADKMIVSAAGAFFNVLFAVAIAAVVWVAGVPSPAAQNTTVVGWVPETISPDGVEIPSPAYAAGIRPGDEILEVDSSPAQNFGHIAELVAMGSGRSPDGSPLASLKIRRGGEVMDVSAAPTLVKTNVETGDEIRMLGIFPASPVRVSEVMEGSPAEKAGLMPGDVVEALDGEKIHSQMQIAGLLEKMGAPRPVSLGILRGGSRMRIEAEPRRVAVARPLCAVSSADGGGKLRLVCVTRPGADPLAFSSPGSVRILSVDGGGPEFARLSPGDILVRVGDRDVSSLSDAAELFPAQSANAPVKMLFSTPDGMGVREVVLAGGASASLVPPASRNMLGYTVSMERVVLHPSVWEQIVENVGRTWGALASLVNPSSDIGLRHLTGPIGIGRVMYGFSFIDISLVLSFVVLININLAILNLLPIPVLDGGHMLIATVGKLMRRPVPESVVAGLQGAFMLFFLGVMLYVVYFDVMRWRGDSREEAAAKVEGAYSLGEIKFK